MIIKKLSRHLGNELSYDSQKLNEILAYNIVRYALKNYMEDNSVTQTVKITVRKFQKFEAATQSFLH